MPVFGGISGDRADLDQLQLPLPPVARDWVVMDRDFVGGHAKVCKPVPML
jgi:hypothetical protein